MDLSDKRKDYKKHQLTADEFTAGPYSLFCKWFEEAMNNEAHEAYAFALSTISEFHTPDTRIVLLKSHSEQGFVFFTNYLSKKGKDIDHNPKVSMLFFWPHNERQVRIEGICQKTSEAESDEYFKTRPRDSQIAAIISKQSQVIDSEDNPEEIFQYAKQNICHCDIQRPKHWGGYLIIPVSWEFWQGRPGRMHQRYKCTNDGTGNFIINRLYP